MSGCGTAGQCGWLTRDNPLQVDARPRGEGHREGLGDRGGQSLAGLHGAYFAGSVNGLADDALVPPTSDLDLNVVLLSAGPTRRGKFVHLGVLLDVTCLSLAELGSPEQVLGHYHLAGGFRTPSIILDPSGQLGALQAAVSRDFGRLQWVRRRCAHARSRILEQLDALNSAEPFHDRVIGWLFATGMTTHVLLVGGLQKRRVGRQRGPAE